MARYYLEKLGGKVEDILVQDETGVYIAGIGGVPVRLSRPARVWVKLPEWETSREVSTTDRDYLDFMRRCERGDFDTTAPTEIVEAAGTAAEIVQLVLARGY